MFRCLVPCALLGAAASAGAEPLNPLDFPSLGSQTLAAGAYTINTSASPPTFGAFTGTVSPSGVAVFCFDNLVVQPGAVITANAGLITGHVALLASGDLVLAGALNASVGQYAALLTSHPLCCVSGTRLAP